MADKACSCMIAHGYRCAGCCSGGRFDHVEGVACEHCGREQAAVSREQGELRHDFRQSEELASLVPVNWNPECPDRGYDIPAELVERFNAARSEMESVEDEIGVLCDVQLRERYNLPMPSRDFGILPSEGVWVTQVRDSEGFVVREWSRPAEAEFQEPPLLLGQEMWENRGKEWIRMVKVG